MNETTLSSLRKIGLNINSLSHISSLKFEAPIKINDVRCLGENSIKLFSYLGPVGFLFLR